MNHPSRDSRKQLLLHLHGRQALKQLVHQPRTTQLRNNDDGSLWLLSSSSSPNDVILNTRGGGGGGGGGGGDSTTKANGTNGGTATISNEIFNLVKSIIGAGVLSLPAGIAAFGNNVTALFPAIFLITIMGTISGYTFSLIARICKTTGATSYSDAWDITRGKQSSWIVALSSALDCLAGNLTYSMVLGDTIKDLFMGLLNINISRSSAILGLTSTVLLPLCLVKNLSSLAPFSLLGIIGMAYTSIAIGIRYFGGSYVVPSGKFLSQLSKSQSLPSFGNVGAVGALSPKSFLLICMLSTAYIAHFNAPKFYNELQNNTMKRFNTVVISSFGISIAVYAAVSSMGFLTFGSATNGMILNSYATTDKLISVSRFAVALSLIFSYPLLFVGARDGLLDLFRISQTKRTNAFMNQFTIGILSLVTTLALFVKDLTFVASMSGAVLGTSLIFIFPTLMFRGLVKKDNKPPTNAQKWESRLCAIIASLGVAVGGIGAGMALQSASFF